MSIATQDKNDVLLAMRVNVWSKVAFVNSIQFGLITQGKLCRKIHSLS